ncbi:hypothetical protein AFLA70_627g000112 [Aspergillus flavus AF70]|nr:hypothetical protein AFLA70_627g000112 [Aspergillus flavus AF70]
MGRVFMEPARLPLMPNYDTLNQTVGSMVVFNARISRWAHHQHESSCRWTGTEAMNGRAKKKCAKPF